MFSAFKKLPADFLKALLSTIAAYTAMTIFFLYPLILSLDGYKPLQIGIAWIVFELALIFSRPWSNYFLHSKGTRKGMITGSLLMASGIAILTIFPSMFFILAGRIVQGTGWGLFVVSYSLHNASTLPVSLRGFGFGLAGIAPVLPQLTFFPLGEWLVLSDLIYTTLIIAIISCIFSFYMALKIRSRHEKTTEHHNLLSVLKKTWKNKEIRAVLLSGSAFAMLAAPILPYIANAAKEWGSAGSAFLLPAALVSLSVRTFVARIVDHYGSRLIPPAFIIASTGLLITCWIGTTPALFAGGILFGTGGGIAYPLIFSEISRIAPRELMTPLFTLFNTFIDAVWVIAPFFAAGIAEFAGFGGTLKISSLIIAIFVAFLTIKIWADLK